MSDLGPGALVMTSGNVSDEPIAFHDDDALTRLAPISDLFLTHDREIETRTDDSVVRVVRTGADRRRPLPLRRSRGYAPAPLPLAPAIDTGLLACGAEQKSTFCVAKGGRAWVSHHVGDLEHLATLEAFREGVAHFGRLFAVTPELVTSTTCTRTISRPHMPSLARACELSRVQHHHAHLAACLAEHGIWDRTPSAPSSTAPASGPTAPIWGGELLAGGVADFERVGLAVAGADARRRRPPSGSRGGWRSRGSPRRSANRGRPSPALGSSSPTAGTRWARIAASAAVSPLTSSIGRLFDAVGALCGIGAEVSYEGQAAVELEAVAWAAGRVWRPTS